MRMLALMARMRRRYAVRARVGVQCAERGIYRSRREAERVARRMNTWPTFGSEWRVEEIS